MRVLVCDNSRSVASLIMRYIKDDSHDVVLATSGEDALILLSSQAIDLVILGVELTGLNGFEVAKEIRRRHHNWIPIIFLTANSSEESLAKGIEAGGDDYLFRPIPPLVLQAKVRAMTRLVLMRNELADLNRQLKKISITDSLTSIMNRRGFEFESDRLWRAAKRSSHSMSVLMIDVDHFKLYNDNYGHPKGDACLKQVAGAISESVVRPLDVVARIGGEEFAVLLPDTSQTGAEIVAQRIIEAVQLKKIEHSVSLASACVTVSVGIAATDGPELYSIEKLLEIADSALYQSKRAGRNQYKFLQVAPCRREFAAQQTGWPIWCPEAESNHRHGDFQ